MTLLLWLLQVPQLSLHGLLQELGHVAITGLFKEYSTMRICLRNFLPSPVHWGFSKSVVCLRLNLLFLRSIDLCFPGQNLWVWGLKIYLLNNSLQGTVMHTIVWESSLYALSLSVFHLQYPAHSLDMKMVGTQLTLVEGREKIKRESKN